MNCLVTGYNGFLAKNLINYLQKKYNVYSISRKKNVIGASPNIIFLDLSKKNSLKKFKLKKVDFIVHVATIMMNNKIKAKTIILKNLNIINNLIKLLKIVSFKKIINISSISLYPSRDGSFNEESSVNFLNNRDYPYAFSKFIAEKKIDTNFSPKKILHLRVAQIVGNHKDSSIITSFKNEIKMKNKISIYGNGKRILNLIHIKKLIQYIEISLRKRLFGVYNIADYSLSLKKIAEILKKKYGNKETKILFKKKAVKNEKFVIDRKKFFLRSKLTQATLKEFFNEI